MLKKRKHRGGSAKLKAWAKKAMGLVARYGPGIARKYKLGTKAMNFASSSLPQYASYVNPVKNMVAQSGYGMNLGGSCGMGRGRMMHGMGSMRAMHKRVGGGTSPTGGSLRPVGGRKYSRRK
jgi:hypothetical protein